MRFRDILCQIFIFLLIRFKASKCSFISSNKLNFYYSAPEFDLKYANVTFASSRVDNASEPKSTLLSLGQTIASICQADLINRNKTQFSFSGLINLIYQDYYSIRSSGQAATMTLFSNNLQGIDAYVAQRNYTANVAGMIGLFDYGTAKINSLVTNDFGIPTLTAGDLARSAPDNQFFGFFPAEKAVFFQTYNTGNYNTFNAVLDVLAHFNWTAVGTVFDANSFGYARQRSVTDYAATSLDPLFACQAIFSFSFEDFIKSKNNESIEYFCACIGEKSTIQVIVLWMGTTSGTKFISLLKDRCAASKDWTFILADDFQAPIDYTPLTNILKNTLLLRGNGPWDFQGFLEECQNGISPSAEETISGLLEEFTQLGYNCTMKNGASLETCTSLYSNNNAICFCPSDILATDPYISRYLFSADIISNLAEGIRLLENNCTFLNEVVDSGLKSKISVPDFCKLTKFTPPVLAVALRFVNFTGYTGEISYEQDYLTRSIKTYFLYSAYTDNIDAVLVGTLNSTSVQINSTAVQFVNGKMPISRVVPQNPGLSYAVVAVFFALSIVFLIICTGLFVILIMYRNNLSMRRTSPMLTLAILFGVTMVALAQLLFSLSRTSATCTLVLYIYHLGVVLILAGPIAKNYRIYRIFSNRTATAVKITESSLFIFVLAVSGIYIAGITVFVAVFGLEAVEFQSSGNIYYKYVMCVIPNSTWNTIFNYYLRIYILIFAIIALILAWLTRNVHSNYRETKTLTAFICTVAAAFVILMPLELIFGDETDSEIFRYIIIVEFQSITVLSALGLLFFPKVYTIYRENKRGNTELGRSSQLSTITSEQED